MKDKNRTVFWAKAFSAEHLKALCGAVELQNGYSIDRFNYDRVYMPQERKEKAYSLSVIVPVYNNGNYLYGKAFASLQRSSMFNEMEIILVDDGSTDGYTQKVIKYLEKRYDNVKTYFFNDGGSGSAARPRNVGVRLATADYISYLDPDDEYISDGIAQLYKVAVEHGFDLTVGNSINVSDKPEPKDYYKNYFMNKYYSDTVKGDKREFLKAISFSPLNINAMVIRKSIITDNNLIQVEGAVGEDSLFSWELILASKSVKSVDLPVLVHYTAVEGSVTNVIGKKYFEKSLLLELERRKMLEKNGLLEDYAALRYTKYITNWTLKKLAQSEPSEKEASKQLVLKIHGIYADVYKGDGPELNEFLKIGEISGDGKSVVS
jgi:glycosyltransferase involved in cell wall biosynthesis